MHGIWPTRDNPARLDEVIDIVGTAWVEITLAGTRR
jgi:hypothetical protein